MLPPIPPQVSSSAGVVPAKKSASQTSQTFQNCLAKLPAAELLTVVFSRAVHREFGALMCISEGSPPCGYMLILNNESRVLEDNTLTCRKWLAGWGDGIRRSSFHTGYQWQ